MFVTIQWCILTAFKMCCIEAWCIFGVWCILTAFKMCCIEAWRMFGVWWLLLRFVALKHDVFLPFKRCGWLLYIPSFWKSEEKIHRELRWNLNSQSQADWKPYRQKAKLNQSYPRHKNSIDKSFFGQSTGAIQYPLLTNRIWWADACVLHVNIHIIRHHLWQVWCWVFPRGNGVDYQIELHW